MKKKLKQLNLLFEKYQENTEGQFHSTLWQVMINEVRKNVHSAFVYIHGQSSIKHNVGIADLNVAGYTPALFSIKTTVSDADRRAMLDEINTIAFGITPDRAELIEFSSYKSQNKEVYES